MDIIVTTPKDQIDNAKKEGKVIEKDGGYWFRVLTYKPKVKIGNKIYFVEDGFIKGYGIVFEITQLDSSFKCDITDQFWGKYGSWIIKYNNWIWLKNPIKMKGFQGFRYVERIEDMKEMLNAAC